MKDAKKIGIVYEQSKSPVKKYIGVLGYPTCTCTRNKRDAEYTGHRLL